MAEGRYSKLDDLDVLDRRDLSQGNGMKIAVIGAGISGLTAASGLRAMHDVTVLEANDYAGGHTNTIDVADDGNSLAIDTGFIVFNRRTYPNFCELLERLEVRSQPRSAHKSRLL